MNKFSGYGSIFSERKKAARKIVKEAKERKYNLIIKNSVFENDTMNYQYLTWWLGNEPVKYKTNLVFSVIDHKDGRVIVKKWNRK